jgi:hypothetical protein
LERASSKTNIGEYAMKKNTTVLNSSREEISDELSELLRNTKIAVNFLGAVHLSASAIWFI